MLQIITELQDNLSWSELEKGINNILIKIHRYYAKLRRDKKNREANNMGQRD